ncbi:MAG: hypothetical protein LBU40_01785, partial [Methanobrevibacter sp.]|nr:hypothetical protein [Methanobrevibacter sp.]
EDLWEGKEDVVRGAEVKYENTINRITSEAMPRPTERIPKDSEFDFEMVLSVYDGTDDFDGDDGKENLLSVFESMLLLEDSFLGASGSRGYGQIKFADIYLIKRDSTYYKEKKDGELLVGEKDEEVIKGVETLVDAVEKIKTI